MSINSVSYAPINFEDLDDIVEIDEIDEIAYKIDGDIKLTKSEIIISELISYDFITPPISSKKRNHRDELKNPINKIKKEFISCEFNGCHNKLEYGLKAQPDAIFLCGIHRLPGMVKLPCDDAICVVNCCTKLKRLNSTKFCSIHDHNSSIAKLNPCKSDKCPYYVITNSKPKPNSKFCSIHKPQCIYKKCSTVGCTGQRRYGDKSDSSKQYCNICRSADMPDIYVTNCIISGCIRQAVRSNGIDKKRILCVKHSRINTNTKS